jgi:hypothetical protein
MSAVPDSTGAPVAAPPTTSKNTTAALAVTARAAEIRVGMSTLVRRGIIYLGAGASETNSGRLVAGGSHS